MTNNTGALPEGHFLARAQTTTGLTAGAPYKWGWDR